MWCKKANVKLLSAVSISVMVGFVHQPESQAEKEEESMTRKGENIYKRKDNRWEARYIKGYDASGKARYGYCYAKTYREAKQKQEQARLAGESQLQHTQPKQRNFSDYCDEWLLINRNNLKESTCVKYHNMLEKRIKPGIGAYPVQKLNSVIMEQFSSTLLVEEGLSPKTVKDVLVLVGSVLKYAEHQIEGKMPYIEIHYPKEEKKEMRVLSKDEYRRFIRYLLQDMDPCKFGVLLSLLTGLRIGEICALRFGDIHLDMMYIRIASTMQRLQKIDEQSGSRTKVIISQPKSVASARLIPLTGFTAELCQQFAYMDKQAFVLTGSKEKAMEPRTLQYRLKKYAEACEIEEVHFHTLRHTFATRCVEGGFELKSLSEVLGHASPTITLERYVHSSLELKRENMEKVVSI